VQTDSTAGVLECRVHDVDGLDLFWKEAAVGYVSIGQGCEEAGKEECGLHLDDLRFLIGCTRVIRYMQRLSWYVQLD